MSHIYWTMNILGNYFILTKQNIRSILVLVNERKTRPHHTNGVGAPLIMDGSSYIHIHTNKCEKRAETLTCILHNKSFIVK